MSKAEDKDSGKKSKAPRGFWSELNRDATITGGIRSTIGSSRRSVDAVRSSTGQLLDASREALAAGRVETFGVAVGRLGVNEDELPLIHNQIILQAYAALVVGVVSLMLGLHYFSNGVVAAGALALVIGITSFFLFAQSSTQAYQIRKQELGLFGAWFSSPAEWFPSRMKIERRMSRSDPLRHPNNVRPLAARARRLLFVSSGLFGLGIGMHLTSLDLSGGPWGILLGCIGLALLLPGARTSFEVFRRREGLHCDVGAWLLSAKDWIPSVIDPRTEDLLNAANSKSKVAVESANDEG